MSKQRILGQLLVHIRHNRAQRGPEPVVLLLVLFHLPFVILLGTFNRIANEVEVAEDEELADVTENRFKTEF
jgi:hypothetical protein